MTVIIDYGVGNLFSLKRSFEAIGESVSVESDPDKLNCADRLVLPGVGAFSDAAAKLFDSGMDKAICNAVKQGKPLLGICLGMQLLFDKSFEYGEHSGLSLIPGEIVPLKSAIDSSLKIPHIGWNALQLKSSPLFNNIKSGDCVYFVHSYYAVCQETDIIATADYSIPVTAAVSHGNVYGTQFHPEKSGEVGLNILRSFCSIRGKL